MGNVGENGYLTGRYKNGTWQVDSCCMYANDSNISFHILFPCPCLISSYRFEALCFLIEVDNIIHASFLGESFEKRVTHRCEVITVSASAQGTWQPYVFFAMVLLLGLGSAPWIRVISPAKNSYSIVKYPNSTAQGFIRKTPSWHSSRA